MGRLADVEWGSASVCSIVWREEDDLYIVVKDEAHYVKLAVDQDCEPRTGN